MKLFCQYLCFFSLLMGIHSNVNASLNSIGCALIADQKNVGALPGFSTNTQPLIGYSCELKPKRSTYLGNWFPSLPQLTISQTKRVLSSDSNATADDYSQSWYADLAIKRIGDSQLVLHLGQKKWQQALKANEDILFFSANTSGIQDAISIQQGQQALLAYSESRIGLSFILPYRKHQPLTRLTLQQYMIDQPIQADIADLPQRSLYNSQINLTEIRVNSESYNKGFNFNWGIALAVGDIRIDSDAVTQSSAEDNEILSIYGALELYYQYRFNRRWFAFSRWQGEIRHWRQGKGDNPDYQLPEANNIEQQLHLGLGLRF
ncbi:MAG: hypothetical protein JKY50_07030 [Oleispira sp.]|nr:hypothetical protein [Oleispira sp.]